MSTKTRVITEPRTAPLNIANCRITLPHHAAVALPDRSPRPHALGAGRQHRRDQDLGARAEGRCAVSEHDLYTNADKDRPDAICDRNGHVVLAQCKRCGKAEIELSEPCDYVDPVDAAVAAGVGSGA